MTIHRRTVLAGLGVRHRGSSTRPVPRRPHPSVRSIGPPNKGWWWESGGCFRQIPNTSGQLGSSRDVIEATSSGAIQMVDEGAAQFGSGLSSPVGPTMGDPLHSAWPATQVNRTDAHA